MREHTVSFLRELADLLDKYKGTITAADEWTGYAECGQDIQIAVETEEDYDEYQFGSWMDAEKIRLKIGDPAGTVD